MKTKPNTRNQGANDERTAVLAHVRRFYNRKFKNGGAESVLDEWAALINWLLKRDDRYNRQPGGLGRKHRKRSFSEKLARTAAAVAAFLLAMSSPAQSLKIIYQHPTTVSCVAVDPVTGRSVTACFDGSVRTFSPALALDGTFKVASQLNACAMYNSQWAADDDASTSKTGVAVTPSGQVVKAADFAAVAGNATVYAIDKTGIWAVATSGAVYNRLTGKNWLISAGTPMGVELLPGGNLVTVALDGYLSVWKPDGTFIASKLVTSEGLNGVDVAGNRLVVTDWNLGIWILQADTLAVVYQAKETALIHSAKFAPDGAVLYVTQDGRFCRWDGASQIASPATSPVSKPGKRK